MVLALAAPWSAMAQQQAPPISTDRPTESASPYTVPRNAFQFETGWKWVRDEGDLGSFDSNSFPDLLFRYGITDRFEARFVMSGFDVRTFGDLPVDFTRTGFADVALGIKTHLVDPSGWRPSIGLLVDASFPVGDPGFTDDYVVPKILMLFDNALSDRLSLTYNVGTRFITLEEENDATRTVVDVDYAVALSAATTDRTTIFIEFWGAVAFDEDRDTRTEIQGGFIARTSNNTQVDIRVGGGLVSTATDFRVGAGFSFRLPR